MAIRRVHRKTDRTPEEQAEESTPSASNSSATGRRRRSCSRQGITPGPTGMGMSWRMPFEPCLDQTESGSGEELPWPKSPRHRASSKGMLSRLENGKILNPTISTLHRYAAAVGMSLALTVQESQGRRRDRKGRDPQKPNRPETFR